MSRTRWDCPNSIHPVVLGPRRPVRDHTCRYCLPCSSNSTRLVLRVPSTLIAERERRTRAKAEAKARKAARANWREEPEEAVRDEGAPRLPGIEYHVISTSGVGVQVFDGDSFREALACLRSNPAFRMTKVTEHGAVYAPIRRDVRLIRIAPNKSSREEGAVIGWGRVEPAYRGQGQWRLTKREWVAQFGADVSYVKYPYGVVRCDR